MWAFSSQFARKLGTDPHIVFIMMVVLLYLMTQTIGCSNTTRFRAKELDYISVPNSPSLPDLGPLGGVTDGLIP